MPDLALGTHEDRLVSLSEPPEWERRDEIPFALKFFCSPSVAVVAYSGGGRREPPSSGLNFDEPPGPC
ncbi:Hypothetical protein NTJ_03033 [Nesidiocoris tenuis]|uniref:Uncharacterized protein n=1 Tax=Nesidiocoris tenuis TaxID=355587 RepID=A0ABN7AH76_9HEMI|nr:Hypothetical protein NTJ_03033 [Nesidiocoris tenuis]